MSATNPASSEAVLRALAPEAPLAPYVGPIMVFGVFTALEGYVPAGWYPVVYAIKALAVTAALLAWRRPLADIRPVGRHVLPSIAIGLALCVAWVGIDKLVPYPHLSIRVGFDPGSLGTPVATAAFLAARFYGLVLMVPVMEEIFWRSFLTRFMTDSRFLTVPLGSFSARAGVVVVVASALAHPEWLVAAIANAVFLVWFARTRSLFAVIVAHAATNAALGAYVLATQDWQYW